MCSIHGITDVNSAECLRILDSEIERLKRKCGTDDEIVDVLISALSFKYWHENYSCQVNSVIESSDSEYVRLHWPLFCKSNIGKVLCCEEKCDKIELIMNVLGRISNYITHRHFDKDNVELISQLAVLIESQTGKTSTDRFEELKRVYGRELIGKADSSVTDQCQSCWLT